jgi:hypothetical protein
MPEIHFRGIMLFRTEDGVISEALFPDTTRRPPGRYHNHTGEKKHHDGEKAVDHHPGVVHWRRPGDEESHTITGVVTFGGGSERVSADVLRDFPEMSSLKGEPLEYDQDAPVAARIDLAFPSPVTASIQLPEQHFYLNSANAVPLVLKLSFDDPVSVIVDGDLKFILNDDEVAIIHHFDHENPTRRRLEHERTITATQCIDHDFKWIYALLKWRTSGDIGDWVDNDGEFPAPTWSSAGRSQSAESWFRVLLDRLLGRDPKGPVTIRVSTCFPGWI